MPKVHEKNVCLYINIWLVNEYIILVKIIERNIDHVAKISMYSF